jgi:two-component system, OmpR family, phosphate regulon sensor histidine kinase PhoR
MLTLPVALLWLRADVSPSSFLSVSIKLAVIFGVACALAVFFINMQERRWARRLQRVESFVSALPATVPDLPEDGPAEFQRLSRAMRAMSARVRQGVERAGLESSRREAILACMAEGVLAVDSDLRIIFCNDAFATAFSARTPVSEGLTLYEVVREPTLREILMGVLRTGSAETDRFQLPTAGNKWFEARALPLNSEAKRAAVIVLHDITDLHNQEQLRKDFVADVSHELRTPLSAIRGYAETLLEGALEDSNNNRRFVEIILSHSVRLANIATDLLVLSELDSDIVPAASLERLSVAELVQSAIYSVQSAAAERKVKLDIEGCKECYVVGLRFRLEQVLVNLLDNAVKFNRPQGKVCVECGPDSGGGVRIAVTDTGIGIPSGDVKKIFERFYRVDKARSRPAGGTGLGLPIVKEVVERMGGTVTVQSVLGQGSKFVIVLNGA